VPPPLPGLLDLGAGAVVLVRRDVAQHLGETGPPRQPGGSTGKRVGIGSQSTLYKWYGGV
jgi:hypothetical protein